MRLAVIAFVAATFFYFNQVGKLKHHDIVNVSATTLTESTDGWDAKKRKLIAKGPPIVDHGSADLVSGITVHGALVITDKNTYSGISEHSTYSKSYVENYLAKHPQIKC